MATKTKRPYRERPGVVEFWKGNDAKWRWHVVTQNGNCLADSGQGYTRRDNCVRGYLRVARDSRYWVRRGL